MAGVAVRFTCCDCGQAFFRQSARGAPRRCDDCKYERNRAKARDYYAKKKRDGGGTVRAYKTSGALPVNKLARMARNVSLLRVAVVEVSGEIGMLLAQPEPPAKTYERLAEMRRTLDRCGTDLAVPLG